MPKTAEEVILKGLCKMVEEDVSLMIEKGASLHSEATGSHVLQRPESRKTIPYLRLTKFALTNTSAIVDMVSDEAPIDLSFATDFALPSPSSLKVAPSSTSKTYKISHEGNWLKFGLRDDFIVLKSYQCPMEPGESHETSRMKEFKDRKRPFLFETRWMPSDALSDVTLTSFRIPQSLQLNMAFVNAYFKWFYVGVALNSLEGRPFPRSYANQEYLTTATDANDLFIRNVCYYARLRVTESSAPVQALRKCKSCSSLNALV
ncbi:hypothetical protein FOL47_011245 [Perkinsus chesapeaki]|uniref:Uncharacterized protein n=1 Tax=Perkinsus chesapeaki TaxID=330153 RepID=A0A7J6MN06_PERCH|nr:hypothetical protein FOL47_011245 [Perkinsus chesapeaki]